MVSRQQAQTLDVVLGGTVDQAREAFAAGPPTRTWTGLADLDALLGQPRPGATLQVVSESPMLRSALAFTAAVNAARRGTGTVLIPTDTTAAETGARLLSLITEVPVEHIRSGRLSADDWTQLANRGRAPALTVGTTRKAFQRSIEFMVLDGDVLPRRRRGWCLMTNRWAMQRTPGATVRLMPSDEGGDWQRVEAVITSNDQGEEGQVSLALDRCRLRLVNGQTF